MTEVDLLVVGRHGLLTAGLSPTPRPPEPAGLAFHSGIRVCADRWGVRGPLTPIDGGGEPHTPGGRASWPGAMVPVRCAVRVRAVMHRQTASPFSLKGRRAGQPAPCHIVPVITGTVSHRAGAAGRHGPGGGRWPKAGRTPCPAPPPATRRSSPCWTASPADPSESFPRKDPGGSGLRGDFGAP